MNNHKVNKAVYFLLSFGIGMMGGHRFYAGYHKSGLLFLACFLAAMAISIVSPVTGNYILLTEACVALAQGIVALPKHANQEGFIEI